MKWQYRTVMLLNSLMQSRLQQRQGLSPLQCSCDTKKPFGYYFLLFISLNKYSAAENAVVRISVLT